MFYDHTLFSETAIEPLDPPAGSKPGDRVYAEGYDKLGGKRTHLYKNDKECVEFHQEVVVNICN